ncbi:hypothetical protein [Sphingobacterium sp. UBA5670]|uniref:hypothetical protein n=1 Tax=Sphingobacterium sp. UBA5670 TaxID=1947502 RepID=UPI0025CDA7B0|nr:hypothetical protein [Sphingobacterium sp. UBA5670]
MGISGIYQKVYIERTHTWIGILPVSGKLMDKLNQPVWYLCVMYLTPTSGGNASKKYRSSFGAGSGQPVDSFGARSGQPVDSFGLPACCVRVPSVLPPSITLTHPASTKDKWRSGCDHAPRMPRPRANAGPNRSRKTPQQHCKHANNSEKHAIKT